MLCGYIKSTVISLFAFSSEALWLNTKTVGCNSTFDVCGAVLCEYQLRNGKVTSKRHSQKVLTLQVFVAALEESETQDHNLNIHFSENLIFNKHCIQYSRLFHPLFLVAVLKPTYMCFQLF
jgi:hypothetical protein